MRKMRWTLAMLKKAARESTSVRQVISRLGLIPAGGNYQQVKKYLEKHQIDTSHFTGQGWSKGKKRPFIPKRTLDAILVNDSDYQSYKLKIVSIVKELNSRNAKNVDGQNTLQMAEFHSNSITQMATVETTEFRISGYSVQTVTA
ncbi:MAG: hypothetical protein AAB570_00395 [Patescibacteria group bacterium]